MNHLQRGFVDELVKVSAEGFHQGPTMPTPREIRKSWYRKLLERFGVMGRSIETRGGKRRRGQR